MENLIKSHQDKLVSARIEAEVGVNMSLISTVYKTVESLNIEYPESMLVMDILDRYRNLVEQALTDLSHLKKFLEEKKNEKS